MQNRDRRYTFRWELLGDVVAGRPNLGRYARLEAYRLMQFTLRDILEQRFDTQMADEIFQQAGKLSGREFYENIIHDVSDFSEFVRRFQESMREMGIGIVRIEQSDLEAGHLTMTVSEDLDCSGLPELDYEFCAYDEGFIAGVLEAYTGAAFRVKEIDCWCSGDRTCRFRAELAQ